MELVGRTVFHSTFGEGEIKELKNDNVFILFSEELKRFVFPDVFEAFIIAKDNEVNEYVKKLMSIKEDVEKSKSEIVKSPKVILKQRKTHAKKKYFFVFQGKTYDIEKLGQFIWAPEENQQGRTFHHWKRVKEVREGDTIFHCSKKQILSISIAISHPYLAEPPKEFKKEWMGKGWKVDCLYTKIINPIITSNFRNDLLSLQPKEYAPFDRNGDGNMGYLYSINFELADFLYEQIFLHNNYLQRENFL